MLGAAMADVDLWYEARPEDPQEWLSVRHFSIVESMSAPFRAGLLCARRGNVDLAAIVGKRATFRILHEEGHGRPFPPRAWSGVCDYMEQTQAEPTGESTYFLEIVPDLASLAHRRACRVFQQRTLPAIVREMLAIAHVPARFAIDEQAYRKLDYRVQYDETDLDFIHRMLAEAGLSYHFDDHSAESVLVITDAPQAAAPRAEVRFTDNPTRADGLHVTHVQISQALSTGIHRLRDYDFHNPGYRLTGSAPQTGRPDFDHEQYRYAPGHSLVETPGRPSSTPVADDRGIYRSDVEFSSARARLLVETAHAGRRLVRYQTNAVELSPGSVFTITDHPHPDLSSDRPLLVIETTIDGAPTIGDWSIGGRAAFADAPYRPPPPRDKPRVLGPQTGIVVGPPNEEIHVDEHGRVRVQMHWDRQGSHGVLDAHSTCWVRVSQGWAGAGYGMMVIPRVGHEVLVAFLDGDPDQPIVVGRLYNETQPLPYTLPRHKTVSTWQSRSTPSSEGYNELKFDDARDHELVYLQAQRDMRKLVKHDESITVGVDRSAGIGAVDSIHAGTKHEVTIGQPQHPPPTIPPTRFTMIDKKITLTTGEATIELDGPDIKLMAKGNILLTAGEGVAIHTVAGGALPGPAPAPGSGNVKIGSRQTMDVSSVKKMTIGTTDELQMGSTKKMHIGTSAKLEVGATHDLDMTSGGPMYIATRRQVEIKAVRDAGVISTGGAVQLQGGPLVQINPTAGLFADRVTEGVSPSPGPPSGLLPILTGAGTVLIGGPSFPFPVRRVKSPDGTYTTLQVGDHILIRPGTGRYRDFQGRVLRDLAIMSTTRAGLARLNNIQNNPGGHNVVIDEYSAADAANPLLGPQNSANRPGTRTGTEPNALHTRTDGSRFHGTGTDSELGYNPDIVLGPRGEPEPSDATLFHELGHAEHNAWGVNRQHETLPPGWDNREEWQNIDGGVNGPGSDVHVDGVPQSPTENEYLGERGYPYRRTDHRQGYRRAP
jgi:type VI secretion system secreted protein VgrG